MGILNAPVSKLYLQFDKRLTSFHLAIKAMVFDDYLV